MLFELTVRYIDELSKHLELLEETTYFHPHNFDRETLTNLLSDPGNHYYVYLDENNNFVGYGMLRTFNKYSIPTLGCVIWKKYRGKGQGRKLVKELIGKAKELNYKKI